MDSILQKLYNGEIYPAEEYLPLMEQYMKLREEQCLHYEEFIKKLQMLEPPLHKEFIKIIDEKFATVPFEMSEMFIDGFRLGARMMIEVYQDKYKTDTKE